MQKATVRCMDGPLPIPNPPRVTPDTLFSGAGQRNWRNHPLQLLTELVQCNSKHLRIWHHKPDCFSERSPSHYTFTMGKVEGGMKCVKYLLFVFNFIFWVSNAVVLYLHAVMCAILVYCAMWSQFCVHFASHLFVVCVGVFTHFMREFKASEAGLKSLLYDSNQIFHWGKPAPFSFSVCLFGGQQPDTGALWHCVFLIHLTDRIFWICSRLVQSPCLRVMSIRQKVELWALFIMNEALNDSLTGPNDS